MYPLFAFLDLNPATLLILAVLAIILYGERLPEVARTAGRRFMEFKKGFDGIQDQLRDALNTPPPSHPPLDQPASATPEAPQAQEPIAEIEPKEGDPVCPDVMVGPIESPRSEESLPTVKP